MAEQTVMEKALVQRQATLVEIEASLRAALSLIQANKLTDAENAAQHAVYLLSSLTKRH